MRDVLHRIRRANRPPFHTLSPAQARRAYVLADKDYLSNPPFDPACGTLPHLQGYGWRR